MPAPEVSIIIPFYNVASYLGECLESVSRQSVSDYELILVDDGSTDGSREIADSWKCSDCRIKLVSVDHGGQGRARNKGLDYARGRYITFVDSDDTVGPDYLKSLLDAMGSGDYDFTMMDVSWRRRHQNDKVLSREQAMEDFLYQKSSYASVCGKLFRCGLFMHTRFREGILYEDMELMSRLILQLSCVKLIGTTSYFYRKHSESTLGHFSESRLDVLDVTSGIVSMIEREMPHLVKGAYDRKLSASFNMLILLAKEGEEGRPEYDECWRMIKRLRSYSLWNPRVRIKNKAGILLSYLGRDVCVAVLKSVC